MIDVPLLQSDLAALRSQLQARAAGFWIPDGAVLRLVAFVSADDMPREVAEGFQAATAEVPLNRRELGIVLAFSEGRRAVSRIERVAAAVGSGYWLHAFHAVRSVAVPILLGDRVAAIIAIALADDEPSDEAIESLLRSAAMNGLR